VARNNRKSRRKTTGSLEKKKKEETQWIKRDPNEKPEFYLPRDPVEQEEERESYKEHFFVEIHSESYDNLKKSDDKLNSKKRECFKEYFFCGNRKVMTICLRRKMMTIWWQRRKKYVCAVYARFVFRKLKGLKK
jgi:hypothetical protein